MATVVFLEEARYCELCDTVIKGRGVAIKKRFVCGDCEEEIVNAGEIDK